MIALSKPIVFFDLETTGTDTQKDKIVSMSCIKINPDGTREEKSVLVNPGMPIPKEASDVHGITDEKVKDAPLFTAYAKGIYAFFYGCDIGGYNSNHFDIPLLAAEMERAGIEFANWQMNLIDVMKIESKLNPRTLSAVYERYTGEELDEAHSATADNQATITVLEHQINKLTALDSNEIKEFTPEALEAFYMDGKKRFDIAGKAYFENDELIWNFGSNRGKPVLADLNYLSWVTGPKANFPTETVNKLNQYKKEQNK